MDDKTTIFRRFPHSENGLIAQVLQEVYQALQAKGYNPVGQIVGYLMSGDPTYITSHGNARNLIRQLERDKILEELVASYLQKSQGTGSS
ncbi:MAG: IreB family regulatory phosphoprotein [Candidatus Wallacebacter cryptica]|nr:IreB family regulatory phosphoprotein [Bacillota bacterium]